MGRGKCQQIRRWLCMVLAGATVGLPSNAQEVNARAGALRVGFVNNYPPFSFVDPRDNQLRGFDVEVNASLSLVWKQPFVQRVGTAAQLFKWLRAGEIDLIGNQLLATPELRQEFKFTNGFVNLQLIVCQRENDNRDFLALEDFQGYKLGVLSGTAVDEQGTAVLGSDVVRFETAIKALEALARKEIDAVIDENLILDHLIFSRHLPLKTTAPFSEPMRSGWAFSADNGALRERFNQGVQTLRQSGRIGAISAKWFGYDVSQKRSGAVYIKDHKP
jgi:putative S-methylcysteine transport system substrate-binding protein